MELPNSQYIKVVRSFCAKSSRMDQAVTYRVGSLRVLFAALE
jgi:hypothetical protein